MNKITPEIKNFCAKYGITEKQFFGKEKIGGSLDLGSVTSIPQGFNPTVGGSLDLRSGLKANKTSLDPNHIFSWQNGKFIMVDGILSEILQKRGNVYKIKIAGKQVESFLVRNETDWAHGDTLKKAKEDLHFKIISEKLKKDPIKKDTVITIPYYRIITGACESGCKNFVDRIFNEKEKDRVLTKGIKAKDLLPILEGNNAYGLERFKQLITFS
jgi:hypothetical protein